MTRIARNALQPVALAWLIAIAVINSVYAAELSDHDRTRLAQFSYAAGEPAIALHWLSELREPSPSYTLARSLLDTGRQEQGRQVLEQLTRGEGYQGEAWLLLARLAMTDSAVGNVEDSLNQALTTAHGAALQEALYLKADLARMNGKLDRAGQILSTMDPGYWAALGYQAMASSYSDTDRTPSRALVALRVALAMAKEDTSSTRSLELQSRLLLRAGYLAFRSEDYTKAIGFLERVRLDSFETPLALYYHGLAHARRQNFRSAMQSWHRARKYPLVLPGVADAWLGMGNGYSETGYLGQAGEAYLAANAAFESERVTLATLQAAVESDGAYQALVEAAGARDEAWFLANSQSINRPRLAYLLQFANQESTQHAIQRVAELESVAEWLDRRARDLEIFRTSLSGQLDKLSGEAQAVAGRQDLSLAIASLQTRLDALGEQVGSSRRGELEAVASTLRDLRSSQDQLPGRLATARPAMQALLRETEESLIRLGRLQTRTNLLRKEAEQALDDLALNFLGNESERVTSALERTEQHIAHLYEHLALKNLDEGAQ